MSNTFTISATFTRTSAEYLASKVIADLYGMRAYYGSPDEYLVRAYYEELVVLLLEGCVASVEYGFKRGGQRVVTLYYEVRSDGSLTDGRSGGVYARADVTGASWFSYLTYSLRWFSLSPDEQLRVAGRLPFPRSSGDAPRDGNGYWVSDRSYSADGVGTQRRVFRPW